jgi:hypothetical protein
MRQSGRRGSDRTYSSSGSSIFHKAWKKGMKWSFSTTMSMFSVPSGSPSPGPGNATSASSTSSPARRALSTTARPRLHVGVDGRGDHGDARAPAGEEARQVHHRDDVALRHQRHEHEVKPRHWLPVPVNS